MRLLKLSAVILSLTVSTGIVGQKKYKSKSGFLGSISEVGVLVGFNASFFGEEVGPYGDGQSDQYDNHNRLGLNSSVFIRNELKKRLFVQLELGWNGRGGAYKTKNFDYTLINSNGSFDDALEFKNYAFDYLECYIALVKKHEYAIQEEISVYTGIGLVPGVLLRQRIVEDNNYNSKSSSEPYSSARPVVLSIAGDLVFASNRKVFPFFMFLRPSLTPMSPFKKGLSDGNNYKTNLFGFTFGFGFHVKGV
ncbi:MAG: hypothetical protein ABJ004_20285 [Cyclobacteriaceae bacterium]